MKPKRRVSNYKTLVDRLNARSDDELCLEAARCITNVRRERDLTEKLWHAFMFHYDEVRDVAKLVIKNPSVENLRALEERLEK